MALLEIGDQIGDWIVEKPIGEGGMGAVFKCHNTLSKKILAAVKVLKSHDLGESRQRFIREVELLAEVQHPAVVRVLGAGQDDERGLTWMAMEYLEGEDLSHRLAKGPLSWDEAARMFEILGDGLLAAHEKGVVHRDIKPPNIMICTDGSPKILDFGIAVQQGATKLTREGLVPGTVAYIAPEVFEGEKPDHRADIYALGLVLWESLTGREAYPEDGESGAHQSVVRIMGEKLRSKAFDPGEQVPEPLRRIVRQATEPDVDARLENLDEFVDVLAETGGHEVPRRRTTGSNRVPRKTASRTSARPVASDTFALDQEPAPPKKKSKTGLIIGGVLGGLVLLVLVLVALVVVVPALGLVVWGMSGSDEPVPAPTTAVATPASAPAATALRVPDEFPFSLPDDADITMSMRNESGGQISYIVAFATQQDPKSVSGLYAAAFQDKGLSVSTSTDGRGEYTEYSVSGWNTQGDAAVATVERKDDGEGYQAQVVWVPAQ